MSQKIRQGNDIDIRWSLLDGDEQPYDLTGKDIAVELNVGTKKVRIKEFDVLGNTLHFIYYGKDQKYLGSYALKYIENGDKPEMITFDTKDAFALVEHSWLAIDEGETPETIQLEVVTVSSELDMKTGPRGYSAYEIAVQEGFVGTEEEWLESLRGPEGEQGIEGPQGEKGDKGDRGEKGDQGIQGPPGSDAEVTQQNIERALGYVPASPDAVPFKIGDGNNSVVQKGGNSAAWGESSVALGKSVTTAEGHDITPESTDAEIIEAWEAAGDEKFALAKGDGASVDGTNCLALGKNSHASGNGTLAKENSANACGTGSKATDKYASARGLETLASGKAADSSGYYTVSSGTGSHSEGKREGISHIEKETFQDVIKSASTESKLYQTLDFSTAADRYEVGYRLWKIANTDSPGSEEDWEDVYDQNIKVTAVYSGGSKWFQLSKKLGIGNKTSRVAIFISSETEVTEYPDVGAKGDGSHIEGISTNALNKGEHGEGCYNKSNQGGTPATNTQHSIGIGSSHNDRKNAVEVMQNGDVYVIGIGGYDGTNAGRAGVLTLQAIINGIATINDNA